MDVTQPVEKKEPKTYPTMSKAEIFYFNSLVRTFKGGFATLDEVVNMLGKLNKDQLDLTKYVDVNQFSMGGKQHGTST